MKARKLAAAVLAAAMFCFSVEKTTPSIQAAAAVSEAKLAAPGGITVYSGSTTATVTWKKVSGADAYGVFKFDSAKNKYVEIKQTKNTSYRLTGLKASSTYKLKIAAYARTGGKLVKQSESAAKTVKTTAAPTSIKLSDKSISVSAGKSVTIAATVSPSAFKDVKWTISDSSAATISASGNSVKIKGVSTGTATLTATAGSKKATCKITVTGSSGSAAQRTSPGAKQRKAGTGAVNTAGEGKVVNIYCWNTDLKNYMERFYTVPSGIKINWVEVYTDSGQYRSAVDNALRNSRSYSADDRIDMFLAEPDYIQAYVRSDYTLDVNSIGVGNYDTMYDFTIDMATDPSTGKVKGVGYNVCPGGVIIRRSIAKDVLGTDDPDELQSMLNTWEKFDAAAEKAAKKGYYMTASAIDTSRAYLSGAYTGIISKNKFNENNKTFKAWLAHAEKYMEKNYALGCGFWEDEKFAQMGESGKAMCFFGAKWYYEYCMYIAQEQCSGDWVFIEGPQAYSWGGTYLMAASCTDNPKVVADIMNAFTANPDIAEGVLTYGNEMPNNRSVVGKYAKDKNSGNSFLGGQNEWAVLDRTANDIVIRPPQLTPYETLIYDSLPMCILDYLRGYCAKEVALIEFYYLLDEYNISY